MLDFSDGATGITWIPADGYVAYFKRSYFHKEHLYPTNEVIFKLYPTY